MIIKEKFAKSVLSKSQIFEYALNPYVGCQHNCVYCYAKFMKRFTGHNEPWGEFVDIKINAPELLSRELKKKKKGVVWISGVCDAYQPFEKKYQITRKCLEILVENRWPFVIQTKSDLVLRDIDLFKKADDCEVGFSIATAEEKIRAIFEPSAPAIATRVDALATLHSAGLKTFVMVAPLLPGAEGLVELIKGRADRVLIDRLNYHYADSVYKKNNMEWAMTDEFFRKTGEILRDGLQQAGILCQ
jgi:DNA repair photolyase